MISLSLLGIAVNALWANKLRSILTLLGVIIGVTSVMTIISALEGMMGAIESQIDRMGPSTFVVTKYGIITSEEAYWDAMKRKPIQKEAVGLIEKGCENCEKVCARAYTRTSVKSGTQTLRRVTIILAPEQPNG